MCEGALVYLSCFHVTRLQLDRAQRSWCNWKQKHSWSNGTADFGHQIQFLCDAVIWVPLYTPACLHARASCSNCMTQHIIDLKKLHKIMHWPFARSPFGGDNAEAVLVLSLMNSRRDLSSRTSWLLTGSWTCKKRTTQTLTGTIANHEMAHVVMPIK